MASGAAAVWRGVGSENDKKVFTCQLTDTAFACSALYDPFTINLHLKIIIDITYKYVDNLYPHTLKNNHSQLMVMPKKTKKCGYMIFRPFDK